MPRVKPIDEYPYAYFDVIETASTEGELKIPCDSHDEASALRAHLYTFRSVLRNTKEKGYEKMRAHAERLSFSISGKTLIVKVKETFGEQKIQEALNGTDS